MESKLRIEPFDPIDRAQVLLAAPQAARAMLEARELAVGLIRGRLRRRYPDLPLAELNLKVIEEISRARPTPRRSQYAQPVENDPGFNEAAARSASLEG